MQHTGEGGGGRGGYAIHRRGEGMQYTGEGGGERGGYTYVHVWYTQLYAFVQAWKHGEYTREA